MLFSCATPSYCRSTGDDLLTLPQVQMVCWWRLRGCPALRLAAQLAGSFNLWSRPHQANVYCTPVAAGKLGCTKHCTVMCRGAQCAYTAAGVCLQAVSSPVCHKLWVKKEILTSLSATGLVVAFVLH